MELKLGEKVRLRRKQLGLTLKDLAGDRVTAAQISAIEKGKCNPSQGLLIYIAERLTVEPEYFMLTEDERNRKKFDVIKKESQEYYSKGDFRTARECMEKVKGMLASLTDDQKGFYYGLIGNCMYENGDFKNAFVTYMKSITYYNKVKAIKEILDIYLKAGSCLAETGNFAVAMGYYKIVILYGDKIINKSVIQRALHNMALCCTSLKRHEEAAYYISQLEEIIDSEDEKVSAVYNQGITMLKGIINCNQKDHIEGLKYFDKAISIYSSRHDILGMGRAFNNYGLCLAELGRTQEAQEYLEKSIEYKRQMDDSSLVESYINVENIYEKQGKWDKALETISSAEEYILAKDVSQQAGPVLMTKFRCLFELGDYDKAEIFAFLALDCIQKTHDTKEEAKLYILISKMYERMGDEKSTLTCLSKASKLM
jgi:tetratricopeptide (TPR) repeat protein